MHHPAHLISLQDIDKSGYDEIMRPVERSLETDIPCHLMEGKVIGPLFFQSSVRTQVRFRSVILCTGHGEFIEECHCSEVS